MSGLFEKGKVPLAEQLRPSTLEDVVGQRHLLEEGGLLKRLVDSGVPQSLLFWGPPGVGKTTLAKIYANQFDAHFVQISAIFSGVADLKKIVAEASKRHEVGELTVLFVDEIHRFNKSQQDAFLPFVESGVIILIGATTENPSFELNSALLSRLQVLTLKPLEAENFDKIIQRVVQLQGDLPIEGDALKFVQSLAGGDARYFLNLLETLYAVANGGVLSLSDVERVLSKKNPIYDKTGEAHYDMISTLHKAVRGSDTDGALYWLGRMLDGGEDPLYIGRRLVRMASEEIGMADPQALSQCLAAVEAYKQLGSPEGDLMLAQAVVYLTLAPKSNAVYKAWNEAYATAKKSNHLPAPMFSRNAPTAWMKDQGYNDGYLYDHDSKNAFSGQNYFPEKLPRQSFYKPNPRGQEREMQKRLDYFNSHRKG
ncbi:MAG: replication-associated recombination protein A [Pseudomonadota bacterium]|nr:replication-associated recombination protein A [Pseudomonadota bacterium]